MGQTGHFAEGFAKENPLIGIDIKHEDKKWSDTQVDILVTLTTSNAAPFRHCLKYTATYGNVPDNRASSCRRRRSSCLFWIRAEVRLRKYIWLNR